MREMLFRGKRKDNGEWVEGYLFDDGLIDSVRMFIGSLIIEDYKGLSDDKWDITGTCFYEVIPETVGQYTGLTDKNGKKIFEGDIVKTKSGRLCEVYWFTSPSMCGWDLRPIECNNPAPSEYDLFLSQNLEVVDNIYTDSELLRKEDKMIHKLYNNDGTVDYHFDKKALDEVLAPFCKERENNDIDGQLLYVSSKGE